MFHLDGASDSWNGTHKQTTLSNAVFQSRDCQAIVQWKINSRDLVNSNVHRIKVSLRIRAPQMC